MPESHIIILGCLNAAAGNATSGKIYELAQVIEPLHNVIDESDDPPEGAVELMEEILQWACNGGTFELGTAAQAQDFTTRCNAYLS